jgi:hypothetical protein
MKAAESDIRKKLGRAEKALANPVESEVLNLQGSFVELISLRQFSWRTNLHPQEKGKVYFW